MSYKEALEDGIPITKTRSGDSWYHPPCHVCGSPVDSWGYIRNAKYTCKDCKQYLAELKFEATHENVKEKRMKQAIKRISKVTDATSYEPAIEAVRKKLDTPGWFQSTEEIMVAIELVYHKVKVYHQVQVYDYKVDFVLPELKVALEIDGAIYHQQKKNKDALRDEVVKAKLGDAYEIIRISTDNINDNITKLLPAIYAVRRYRTRKN